MDKYIFREWIIVISVLINQAANGFVLALHGLITPAITGNRTDSDIHATREQASWFNASYGLTGAMGFIILPAMMQLYGRRFTFIFINLLLLTGSVITALAADVNILIVGRLFNGLEFAGIIISCVIVAEYSHPKRRGMYLGLKVSSSIIGQLLCHCMGLTMSWRQIAWFTTLPTSLAIIFATKWPESPAWFAYKSRYEDCARTFEYMRGNDRESKQELEELIFSQKKLQKMSADYGTSISQTLKASRSKDFLKPLLIGALVGSLLPSSGGIFLMAYLIEIMTKLSGDRSKALYFSIAADIMELVGASITCWLIKIIKRRPFLFFSCIVSFFFLGLTCLLSFLESREVFHSIWLAPSCLVMYISFKEAMLILVITIKTEIFPLRYRGLCNTCTGIFLSLSVSVYFKLTATFLPLFDFHGTFAIYLALCIVIAISLYFVLPETKDMTLQTIENDFTNLKLEITEYDDEMVMNAALKNFT